MTEIKLSSELRTDLSKAHTKQLRRDGKIPAIYYFHQQKPVALIIDQKDFRTAMQSSARILDLQIGKKRHKCVIKDVQYHPVTDVIQHIDFMGVNLTEIINIKVPVHVTGEAIGVKTFGGVLEQHLWEVEVKCQVANIPEDISIDVSELGLNDSISVADLEIENVEILTTHSAAIVSVVLATGAKEKEEVEEEEELAEGEEGEETEEKGEETEE